VGRRRAVVAALAVALGALVVPRADAVAAKSPVTSPATRPDPVYNPATRPADGAAVRPLPSPLFGVTVDSVSDLGDIVAGAEALPDEPTTRIYFDVRKPASYYAAAVRALQPVSYVMGELLDSSDSRRIGVAAYNKRVRSYLAAFGDEVDVWEIGNEVNGDWTGRYPKVEAKLTDAYNDVAVAGGRSALTLYYDVGCGDGPRELDPLAFSRQYVPASVRSGLSYVLLSYYEDECNGIRPSAATWTAYFEQLHTLYPDAQVGFGEIGMAEPATGATLAAARSLMGYYYGLQIPLPYYAGGYFWWYYDEDCLPVGTGPLWPSLQSGFAAEAAALAH